MRSDNEEWVVCPKCDTEQKVERFLVDYGGHRVTFCASCSDAETLLPYQIHVDDWLIEKTEGKNE